MIALKQMTHDAKPFDASFGASERYTQPHGQEAQVTVVVDDVPCAGVILGRNGPRVQVRFEHDAATYVRWFDADAVLTAD